METRQPPSPIARRPFRFPFVGIFLAFILIITIGGSIVSFLFMQQLGDFAIQLQQDAQNVRPVGACATHTRTLETDAGFMAGMTFSYPCGWHVLEQPLRRNNGPYRNIISDYISVNPLPISLAPRDVETGRIMIRIDEQDDQRKSPALPTLETYIQRAQSETRNLVVTKIVNDAGIQFTKITGNVEVMGNDAYYETYFTEWQDLIQPTRRMVVVISSGNPAWEKDGSTEQALKLLVETMKQI